MVGGWVLSSLDTYDSKANKEFTNWSRQRKRAYHRITSILSYWRQRGYQVLWLCLTTSRGGVATHLAYNHRQLKQRVERTLRFNDIEHLAIRTSEGNGVLHLFWAWKKNGFRASLFYVKQAWLSSNWEEIHGAPIVWISKLGGRLSDTKKVTSYTVSHYCSNQELFERLTWSWFRLTAVPERWKWFKRNFPFGLLSAWHSHLGGRSIIIKFGYDFWLIRPPPFVGVDSVVYTEQINLRQPFPHDLKDFPYWVVAGQSLWAC